MITKKILLYLVGIILPIQIFADQIPVAILSKVDSTLTFTFADQTFVKLYHPDTTVYKINFEKLIVKWTTPTPDTLVRTVVFDESFRKARPKYTRYWFRNLTKLETIKKLDNLNTDSVTDMYSMFAGCTSLKTLDLRGLNTENVTNMKSMFEDCSELSSLNVSSFNTKNVTDMNKMFCNCSSLTDIDLSNFYTPKVKDMEYMFHGCSNLVNLDLSNFHTYGLLSMEGMFSECKKLKSINLDNFNTQYVMDMNSVFRRCYSLVSLDLRSFSTSNVRTMKAMFYDCRSLTNLDISSFDTFNVSDMFSMFYNCSSLTSLDVSNFNLSGWRNIVYNDIRTYWMSNWMLNCTGLKVLNVGGNSDIYSWNYSWNWFNTPFEWGNYNYTPAFSGIGTADNPCTLVINDNFDKSVLGTKKENATNGYYYWKGGYFSEPTTDGITGVKISDSISNDAPAFNLSGQRVGKDYKGVIIVNGKKVIRK